MTAIDPTNTPNAQQVDDHVQNSALGAVKPLAEHPGSGKLVPVSAATPDAEPKAERIQPPQKTGHDIGRQTENSSTTPATHIIPDPENEGKFITQADYEERRELADPYRRLAKEQAQVKSEQEVIRDNADKAKEQDKEQVKDETSPLTSVPKQSDPPFPRATAGKPPLGPKTV